MEDFLYPLNPDTHIKLPKAQHRRHCDAPKPLLAKYCAGDVVASGKGSVRLRKLIKSSTIGQQEEVRKWMTRGQTTLARMERRGIHVDPTILKSHLDSVDDEIMDLTFDIREVAEEYGMEDFNINSSPQKKQLLFDGMGLPVMYLTNKKWVHSSEYKKDWWKGKGNPSTGSDGLELIKEKIGEGEKADFLTKVIRLNQLTSLRDNVLTHFWLATKSGDGRVHTSFSSTKLLTGQLTSQDPPMLNVAQDPLRRCVTSRFGDEGRIVELDFSQLHLRLIGNLAECGNFIDAYSRGEDFHTNMARDVITKMSAKEFLKKLKKDDPTAVKDRKDGKQTNFSIIFEIGPNALSFKINRTQKETKDILARWFTVNPEIADFTEANHQFAKEHGYMESKFGRIRHLPNAQSPHHGLQSRAFRQAGDYIISNTGRYMMFYPMIGIDQEMVECGMKSQVVLQVHDSLIADVHVTELDWYLELAKKWMIDWLHDYCPWMNPIPLVVEGEIGHNWYKQDALNKVTITKEGVEVK